VGAPRGRPAQFQETVLVAGGGFGLGGVGGGGGAILINKEEGDPFSRQKKIEKGPLRLSKGGQ